MQYATTKDADVTWREPQICCPNCKSVVLGIAVEMTTQDCTSADTKYVPSIHVTSVFRVGTCGCQVSADWRDSYMREVASRRAGNTPRKIVPLSASRYEKEKNQLLSKIKELMQRLADIDAKPKYTEGSKRSEVERLLVLETDALMRLTPGDHNKLPGVELSDWTKQWATKNGYVLPPEAPVQPEAPVPPVSETDKTLQALKGWPQPPAVDFKAAGYLKQPVNPSKVPFGGTYVPDNSYLPGMHPDDKLDAALLAEYQAHYLSNPISSKVKFGEDFKSYAMNYWQVPEDKSTPTGQQVKEAAEAQALAAKQKLDKDFNWLKAYQDKNYNSWTGTQQPKSMPDKKNVSAEADAMVKRVTENLKQHAASGIPLTAESRDYLEMYEKLTGNKHPAYVNKEVPEPSTQVSPQDSIPVMVKAETLLDRLSSRPKRKFGRLKQKGQPQSEVSAVADTDDDLDASTS